MRHSAIAFIIPIAAGQEPYVQVIEDDHDAFDSADCSIYSDETGDTGSVIEMIENSLVCDCGNDIFVFNRCTGCGSPAPWASKFGCGLA
jgi:hypothetical protein